jgi:GNAT superfamily N-acetyltransferase
MSDQPGIRIAHLCEHPDAVPLLAAWGTDEWGHLNPDRTLADRVESFAQRTRPGTIPETLVAVDRDQVIGMASIVENDLSIRSDLSPWMAAVYVDASHRGRGVGSVIVRAIMDLAGESGIDRLYLLTHDRMSFYRRLGWTTMERVHYRGEDVTIMFYDTSSS